MAFRVEPCELGPEGCGADSVVLVLDHDLAVPAVGETRGATGLGAPAEFSSAAVLSDVIDDGRNPYRVLDVCCTAMAGRSGPREPARRAGSLSRRIRNDPGWRVCRVSSEWPPRR